MVGPNLNEIRPDKGRVKNAVLNGIGVMPAYQGVLNDDEIDAVSYYVSESANNWFILKFRWDEIKLFSWLVF